MTQATQLRLTGLDAQDPLAFLAALGCLLGAGASCQRKGLGRPTLHFDLVGVPTPILTVAVANADELLDLLAADLDDAGGRSEGERDPFLAFSYPDGDGSPIQDLKPPPQWFRDVAQAWIADASHESQRTTDWAAAVLTDAAVDNNGAGKPFALHFTAGQQRFLNVAQELLDGAGGKSTERRVDRDDLRAAVFGPWPNNRALKVFSWSPTQDRAYALRAGDPSTDKKLGTPGADWLALRGIGHLSSAPRGDRRGDRIVTSGVLGGWKTGTFSYPIWRSPLDEDAVRSLLRHPAIRPDARARPAEVRSLPRGVEVLTCRISRSDQGGYGSFSRPTWR
jgi:hypothetical protein